MLVRWRLNEPTEENRERWTRVHVAEDGKTFCGVDVPEWPYMLDEDRHVPGGAARCRKCVKSAVRSGVKINVLYPEGVR